MEFSIKQNKDTYAELCARTNFSFLQGASHPEEMVEQAAALGLAAIGIVDHDGVYGIPKAYWAKKNFSSLRLLSGAHLKFLDGSRLALLAKDRAGYGLLCRLLTASHAGKEKGQASLTPEELQTLVQQYPRGSTGLIALADAENSIPFLLEAFPRENIFRLLRRNRDGRDKERTRAAWTDKQRFGLPIVATSAPYYHRPERRRLHDVLTSIRELKPLTKIGAELFSNEEHALKSPAAMRELFADLPEALENTLLVSEACQFCPSELRYRYPVEWIPEGHSADSYLRELTWRGAKERYPQGVPKTVRAQIEHELELIARLSFADYFLTIYDIVVFARSRGILCQGRGSAANSVICYVLGITAVDPVSMNLLFARFISVERNEPPDIDVDFEHERREEVIQYIYERYGRDRAAMVSAVITYRTRSALREVAKAFSVEVGTLSAKKIDKHFAELAKTSPIPRAEEFVRELAHELKGFPRHLSIHSGGFTLSADPIIEIVPVEPARMEGRTIIQWDKYDLDYLGLLKIDVLALGMLSALRKNLELVGLELHQIPADDPKTYAMIQRADTVGTFQIESRAQMSMLGRLLPKNFYDLVIEVAIVRPGPIVGKMVHPYLRRRRGLEPIDYPHPKLKEILGRTLGVPLFQEQVMKMAIELAGFSPGEADALRRAIGAWRSSGSIEKLGKKLMQGLRASGLSQEFCERIFQQIQGFAEYGFPESHAASFALIAYASCYLKCHYPAEFYASVMNSQPMGFYANHSLVDDAKRHGVTVLPVDPNHSAWDSEIVARQIQLGWHIVKGLHRAEAEQIIAGRPYTDLGDFLRRNRLRPQVLQRLAMGDAFRCFQGDQRQILWNILDYQCSREAVQLDLFSHQAQGPSAWMGRGQQKFYNLSEFEMIREDYAAYGLSARAHPMQALRKILRLPRFNTKTVRQMAPNSEITIAGLTIVRQRPPTASGMTFATLEDEYGFLDTALPKAVFEKYRDVFLENCFLIIRGRLQRDMNSFSLLVRSMREIWPLEVSEKLMIEPDQYFW